MRFENAYTNWQDGRITQSQAAEILGVSDRTFRRYICRYEEQGLDGLYDHRITQVSHKSAPVDEVMALESLYRKEHMGWNVKHFYSWYCREGKGQRSYTWVKNKLQDANLVPKAKARGKHRRKRERAPMAGMLIHQDASTHEWVEGHKWDLVVTMDDATGEHYSMFFVEEEGTLSSFRGVKETIQKQGLFCSFYSDRGSHYWTTKTAGKKVDKENLTQFGSAMRKLGIDMIAAYSPEARGRSERAFKTHQGRLPQELKKAGVDSIHKANEYIQKHYLPAHNHEFMVAAQSPDNAFVPCLDCKLDEILCEEYQRKVRKDNCISFEGAIIQIPCGKHRYSYANVSVRVKRYPNGSLAVFHGPRLLGRYTYSGKLIEEKAVSAAA